VFVKQFVFYFLLSLDWTRIWPRSKSVASSVLCWSSWTCWIPFIWCQLLRQSTLSRTLHITSQCHHGRWLLMSLVKVCYAQ